jgi:hypothetical protein
VFVGYFRRPVFGEREKVHEPSALVNNRAIPSIVAPRRSRVFLAGDQGDVTPLRVRAAIRSTDDVRYGVHLSPE